MNINLYILLAAFVPALLVFWLAKKFQWDDKIPYHLSIAIVGFAGLIVFSYLTILHFNIAYLMINILIFMGIILKLLKILLIRKSQRNKKDADMN